MPGVCSIEICHTFKHIKVQEVVLNKHPLQVVAMAKQRGTQHPT